MLSVQVMTIATVQLCAALHKCTAVKLYRQVCHDSASWTVVLYTDALS